MAIIELVVDGDKHEIDTEELLVIEDVSTDMSRVAAEMAYYSAIHAAAEEERVQMDTYYRKWRAVKGQDILNKDAKLAEWKVRQIIESDPKFDQLKAAMALSVHNTTLTRGIYEALKTKAQMLQSKGAMLRAELDSTGMSTPSESPRAKRKRAESEAEAEDKMEAMRRANKKKKQK